MEPEDIKDTVKRYILREFLPGESPEALTDSTALVTSGILDSLATLKLVAFLEAQYSFQLEAHEVDAEHLNTLSDIANLILSKTPGKPGKDSQ